jgi:hypothetical protein
MACHICGQEAVSRCFQCGELFCAKHGDVNCTHCTDAIAAGDPRPDRISAARLRVLARPGWWRPQPAEEYAPPACYQCKGIARRTCPNCQQLFCPDHAGSNGMCAECQSSSRLGVVILAAIAGVLAIVVAWGAFRPAL